MTMAEVQAERARIDDKAQAEALAAESAAVFNLAEIRKLEARIGTIEDCYGPWQGAQAKLDIEQSKRIESLEHALEEQLRRIKNMSCGVVALSALVKEERNKRIALETRIKEMDVEAIGWIEALQDANGMMRSDIVRLIQHCTELQNALADARRDTALLTRLVERMGRDLGMYWCGCGLDVLPYTVIGQAEHDAAMQEEEGEPETRESTGYAGYGGPR